MSCRFCQEQILRNNEQMHTQACPNAPSHCDICKERFSNRLQLETHQSVRHFKGPAECYFGKYGCPAHLATGEEFDTHYATDLQYHLGLVTAHLPEVISNPANNLAPRHGNEKNIDTFAKKHSEKHRLLEKFMASTNYNIGELKDKLQRSSERASPASGSVGTSSVGTSSLNAIKNRLDVLERRLPSIRESESLSGQAREISQLMARITEFDGRLKRDVTGRNLGAGFFNGVLTWKIPDYQRRKQEALSGRNVSVYSPPFYSGEAGYKMCARIYLNGDGTGKGKCLSLFFVLMKGDFDDLLDWPFTRKITFSIICPGNPSLDSSDTFVPERESTSFRKPLSDMNIASGVPELMSHSEVESKYVKGDTLYVRIKVHDPSQDNAP